MQQTEDAVTRDTLPLLQEVTGIEVLSLSSTAVVTTSTFFQTGKAWRFAVLYRSKVTALQCQMILQVWSRLPPGEEARCHTPEIGLRFLKGEEEVMRAALCFTCNNISIRTAAGDEWLAFDAEAGSSRSLLRQLHSHLQAGQRV